MFGDTSFTSGIPQKKSSHKNMAMAINITKCGAFEMYIENY